MYSVTPRESAVAGYGNYWTFVSYFSINSGASRTTSKSVTLNNTATGSPTYYMASESSSFSGASWQTYSTAPSFTLSSGNATKTVYFKVKNSAGESAVVSDSITLNETSTQYTLTVSKSGTGSGTVTSSPSGISCGSDCTENYNSGTSVTLTQSASSGSTFAGWGGSCSGTGSCTVTMDAAKTVTATFNTSSGSPPASFTLTGTAQCSGSSPQILLSGWSSSGADTFDLYRNGSLYSSANTGSTFSNTSVTAGTTYSYYVVAKNSYGSTTSNTISVTASSDCGGTTTVTVTGISPTTFTSSSIPYSPVITVSGTGLDQITKVTYSWTGPSSATANGEWASSGTTSRTLNPTVLTSGDPSGTWTWTVYFYNSAGSQITSKTFTVTYNPTTGGSQTERITDGSFSSGSSSWTLVSDFWAGTNLTRYRTSPGYASGGVDSGGSTKINASGYMYQSVAIPSTATSATLSFWLNITSDESSTTTQYDKLFVEVLNSSGTTLATVATYSNLDKGSACSSTCTYSQKSFDLTSYKGQTIRIQFRATTDSASDTVFRIDDVSLMSDG